MLGQGLFEAADEDVDGSQQESRAEISRIGLLQTRERLDCASQIARDLRVVSRADAQPLQLPAPLSQLESLGEILDLRPTLSHVAVGRSEEVIAHRKVRIELHGALKERHGFVERRGGIEPAAFRKRAKRFERRGGGPFDRRVKLLNGGERLAQPGPKARSRLAQFGQHGFLGSRLTLLARDRLSGGAVGGVQCDQRTDCQP